MCYTKKGKMKENYRNLLRKEYGCTIYKKSSNKELTTHEYAYAL